MLGVLEGFGVIAVVVVTGLVMGRTGILGEQAQRVIAGIVFYLATPALLFTMIAETDLTFIFSTQLIATGGSAVVCAILLFVVTRWVRKRSTGEAMFSAWSVSYVNIGNLGIPIALYVLGDIVYVAPVLLFQLLLLAPIGMAVLDTLRMETIDHWWSPIVPVLRNPIVLGAVAGIAVSGTGVTVPTVLFDPLSMIGEMSVPGALLAFGLSFSKGWSLPARGTRRQLTLITTTKLILQPVLAWVIGGPLLGWEGTDLLAIVITSALPTAQNVYIYAMRYRQSETLVRDSVFITTILSIPAILLCAALLG